MGGIFDLPIYKSICVPPSMSELRCADMDRKVPRVRNGFANKQTILDLEQLFSVRRETMTLREDATNGLGMIHSYYTCLPLLVMIPGTGIAYLAVIHFARTRESGAWKRGCGLVLLLGAIQLVGLAGRRVIFAIAAARSGPRHGFDPRELVCNNHNPAMILAVVGFLLVGVVAYTPIVLRSVPPERRTIFLLGLAFALALAVPAARLFVLVN